MFDLDVSDDRVSGDVLSAHYSSATFFSRNALAGQTVSVSGLTISGDDADNYTLVGTTTTTTADVARRSLRLTAVSAVKNWQFEPARRGEEKVPGEIVLSFAFRK